MLLAAPEKIQEIAMDDCGVHVPLGRVEGVFLLVGVAVDPFAVLDEVLAASDGEGGRAYLSGRLLHELYY